MNPAATPLRYRSHPSRGACEACPPFQSSTKEIDDEQNFA